MPSYRDIWYTSLDGLQLYARDYASPQATKTLLCLHGLTRNSADFEPLAGYLCPQYRLLVPDQRGRGRSDRDPNPLNYHPATYVGDMEVLLTELGVDTTVLIGTSMGGLMAMIMAATNPGQIEAVVLNDIGPEIDPEGIARLKTFVGRTSPARNWRDAVARTRTINGRAFPDFTDNDWQAFARRLYRENEQGVPVLRYDPAIAEPMTRSDSNASVTVANFWPMYSSLLLLPAMLIRGELSDILSADTAAKMKRLKPDLEVITVPGRGHAPILDEPEVRNALTGFLQALG